MPLQMVLIFFVKRKVPAINFYRKQWINVLLICYDKIVIISFLVIEQLILLLAVWVMGTRGIKSRKGKGVTTLPKPLKIFLVTFGTLFKNILIVLIGPLTRGCSSFPICPYINQVLLTIKLQSIFIINFLITFK